MCVEINTEGPSLACRNMYLWYILPPTSSIDERDLPLQRRLIDDVVGFSTIPAAGDGTMTHLLYVSLVPSQMEAVFKTCLFEIGQYHLALLNSPQEEAYKHLFRGLSLFRPKKKPRESYWPIILWASISRPISSPF